MRRLFRDALVSSALSAWACSLAHAHAPLPQRVAVTSDGGAIALSLPGFGLVFRAREGQPFAYACDALLGIAPSDRAPALSFLRDGSLLMGSPSGVRIVSAEGCPGAAIDGPLASAAIVTMSKGAADTVYAVASGGASGLWRSSDGGQHWQLRAAVADSENATALAVSARSPEQLYISLRAGAGATLLASNDGGASFTAHAQTLPLTLLSADGPAPYPLWAVTRDALTMGNRGLAVMRAQRPEGPWQEAQRVNYFGGLTIDAQGVIWIGDEIGGLQRSDDGGAHFQNLEADADIACLTAANGTLWACTPGTNAEPALQRIANGQPRSAVVTLDAVDQLVSCRDQDVSQRCAAAWSEWQRDVLQRPLATDAAAPVPVDAGTPDAATSGAEPDAQAGGAAPDAHVPGLDASAQVAVRSAAASCAVRAGRPTDSGSTLAPFLGLALALRAGRKRRLFSKRI